MAAFWYQPAGAVLRALGWLAPGQVRPGGAKVPPPVPVISVGSLSLGGTGKTPTVIAIAQRLERRRVRVHVVTRGRAAPHRVDLHVDRVADVGDEALLIAAFAPTWIAADALAGVRAAAEAGAAIVVLDGDWPRLPVAGAQVVVEDAQRGFGNGLAWPLGPLKTRLPMPPADLLITVGPPPAQEGFTADWGMKTLAPRARGHLAALPTGMDWQGLDVVAFAGINAPERFFATLRAMGAKLHRAQALHDHQELTPALMLRLEREAALIGAQLVTTEKDAVRLPASFRSKVVSLPVRLELDDWSLLDALLP